MPPSTDDNYNTGDHDNDMVAMSQHLLATDKAEKSENSKTEIKIEPDFAAVEKYLKRLDPNTTGFTFQTFDDNKNRKDKKLTHIFHGSFNQHRRALAALNKKGAGIFVTVNETDGKGRKKENIVRARWIFADDDKGTLDVESLPLKSHIVVSTSDGGNKHCYWEPDSIGLTEFTPIQKSIIEALGTDSAIHNVDRVMRVPGFFHNKGEPYLVTAEYYDTPAYSIDEIEAAFPPNGEAVSLNNGSNTTGGDELNSELSSNLPTLPHDINKTQYMLDNMPAEGLIELEWKQMVWAGAREENGSDEMRGRMRKWSKQDPRYDSATFDADFNRWAEKEHEGFRIGSAYKLAAEKYSVDFDLYERAKLKSAQAASVDGGSSTGAVTVAEVLAEKIYKRISGALKNASGPVKLDRKKLNIRASVIASILQNSFWNPDKNSVFMLGDDGQVNRHKENKAFAHLQDACGQVLNTKYLYGLTSGASGKGGAGDRANKAAAQIIQHYLEGHQQRSSSSIETDMFIDKGFIEMRKKTAHITFKFDMFPVEKYEQAIIDDYLEHFPLFEEMLRFIIASRFAVDGRNSYLWLNCQSNWGKTFFMMLFERLGASVKVSLSQVENFASGAPVGLDASDFVNAMVMFVEEFNRVSRELKELTGCISASPKNKMQFTAQLYSKILMSAEGIVSLEGIDGVEDQFANRFCVFALMGDLTTRPVYLAAGKKAYFDSVRNYMAQRLNDLISQYVALGREQASIEADKELAGFVSRHSIKNTRRTLSNALEDIADECRHDIELAMNIALAQSIGNELSQGVSGGSGVPAFFKGKEDWAYLGDSANPKQLYLQRPDKVVRDWIDATRDKSAAATLRHKAAQLVKLISDEGDGVKSHRVNGGGHPKKLLKLRADDLVTNVTKAERDLVGAVDLLKSAQHNINEAANDGENIDKLARALGRIRGKSGCGK